MGFIEPPCYREFSNQNAIKENNAKETEKREEIARITTRVNVFHLIGYDFFHGRRVTHSSYDFTSMCVYVCVSYREKETIVLSVDATRQELKIRSEISRIAPLRSRTAKPTSAINKCGDNFRFRKRS